MFPGHLTHAARPTTRGLRYVVVAFLYELQDEGAFGFGSLGL